MNRGFFLILLSLCSISLLCLGFTQWILKKAVKTSHEQNNPTMKANNNIRLRLKTGMFFIEFLAASYLVVVVVRLLYFFTSLSFTRIVFLSYSVGSEGYCLMRAVLSLKKRGNRKRYPRKAKATKESFS